MKARAGKDLEFSLDQLALAASQKIPCVSFACLEPVQPCQTVQKAAGAARQMIDLVTAHFLQPNF